MKNEKILIRKVIEKDMLTVYEQICELESFTFEIKYFENIFFHNINDTNKLYYLAEDTMGNCLGFISCHIQFLLHHCGKVAEIQELFVKTDYRNRGVGGKLIGYIEEMLKELDCVSFEVTAQNKRLETHEFYKNNGFKNSHLKFTKTIE
jgi:PhnO protein